MKTVLLALMFLTVSAHADWTFEPDRPADPAIPGPFEPGNPGPFNPGNPGGPGRPFGDICNASYSGTWYNNNRREFIRIDVVNTWSGSPASEVTITQNGFVQTTQGNCQYFGNGSAQLTFSGGWFQGQIQLDVNGFASGHINRFRFDGQRDGGPGPGPGPGPSLCNGEIFGNLNSGHQVRLSVRNWGGGPGVTVTVYANNANEQIQGHCSYDSAGARLSFQGRWNYGDLRIHPNQQVLGVINRFNFSGYIR